MCVVACRIWKCIFLEKADIYINRTGLLREEWVVSFFSWVDFIHHYVELVCSSKAWKVKLLAFLCNCDLSKEEATLCVLHLSDWVPTVSLLKCIHNLFIITALILQDGASLYIMLCFQELYFTQSRQNKNTHQDGYFQNAWLWHFKGSEICTIASDSS